MMINGVNSVKRIEQASKLNGELVRGFLKQLLYLNFITLVDTFQFSNIYMLCPNVHKLLQDNLFTRELIGYSRKGEITNLQETEDDLRKMVLSFDMKKTFGDILVESRDLFKVIDPLSFIRYAQINGILRRVHEYPLTTKAAVVLLKSMLDKDGKEKHAIDTARLFPLVEKSASLDMMCSELGVPRTAILEFLNSHIKFIKK
jgi:hypothetical protein